MSDPNFIILYVASPTASAAFYAQILGRPAMESSPNFAMFRLDSGVMLGLWANHDVAPAITAPAGGNEIAFSVPSPQQVDQIFAQWTDLKLNIAQSPTQMDFGYTFVATDPDGHRLRVFSSSENQ